MTFIRKISPMGTPDYPYWISDESHPTLVNWVLGEMAYEFDHALATFCQGVDETGNKIMFYQFKNRVDAIRFMLLRK